MKFVRGYSEFISSLNDDLQVGVVADANVLISASYDLDSANAKAVQFFDLLAEKNIPILCNVIAKLEFLEIHRRIIFTEALLDFESQVDKSLLPKEVASKFNSIRSRAGAKMKQGQLPLRLFSPSFPERYDG